MNNFLRWLINLFGFNIWQRPPPVADSVRPAERGALVDHLHSTYGIKLIESDPKGNARPLSTAELLTLRQTLDLLGETWSAPFREKPIHFWIDRTPGGGHYGNQWLRIGEPHNDLSVLYRIFIHEGTHASNEYRGWLYENAWCFKNGLDWRKEGDEWTHPRQQGKPLHSGDWETLPVDSRDVSTAPGEDLAEMVRYYVHSVREERAYLWPLDLSKPPTYLWETSPTRFVFVRDVFLRLPEDSPLYKRLSPALERRAAANLGL
jgi:hypothetical protein